MLANLHRELEDSDSWTPESLEEVIRSFAEQNSLGFGKVAQPLRAALTGGASSPGIFDVLIALGREESLSRINDQVSKR